MTSIKNNKFKLVSICISLYLYEIIIGVTWIYNVKKIMINTSTIQNLIIILLLQLLMLLPIIIGTLTTNLKNFKLSIKNSLKFKIIFKKIFYTITFSAAVIFIIYQLKTSSNYSIFIILNLIPVFILALPEEILFRWFFQENLEELISNKFIATLITGLLFAIIHIPNDINLHKNIVAIVFLIGRRTTFHFFMNFIKEKSNSIIVPTIVHAIYNYIL
ncbi:CPBP family intramembrane glutamic endopeptidase [Clostridium nigeriense]|uniref:CPBP family intramembrane glutamic endopeptidase n=1 Tax=Clostridium nigeriense TaxID=1805470 RepID=UPI003D34034F